MMVKVLKRALKNTYAYHKIDTNIFMCQKYKTNGKQMKNSTNYLD
jgi:hypothetical protein